MKNNAKRLLAFLLAALLCVTMVVPAFATEADADHSDHTHEVVCPEGCKHECETKHANSEVIEVVAPKCTNAGYTLKYCFDCKHYFVTDPVAAAEDAVHAPGKEPVIEGQAPTCISTGVEATYECTVCGAKCDKDGGDVDVLPLIDHQYKDGLCIICGKHEDDTCVGPHTWELIKDNTEKYGDKYNVVKPTDKTNGKAFYECTVCGAIKEVVILAENARFYPSSLYADIDFNADGTWGDRLGKLETSVIGTPVIGNTEVTFNGTTLTVPALQASGANVGKVVFKELETYTDAKNFWNDVDGFSFEVTFLATGTGTRGIFGNTQSSMANTANKTGATGFALAVNGDNKPYLCVANSRYGSNNNAGYGYLNTVAPDAASTTELIHIVCTVLWESTGGGRVWRSIYVNGVETKAPTPYNAGSMGGGAHLTTAKNDTLASTFLLGGDANPTEGAVDFQNTTGTTTIVDFKFYDAQLTADEVAILYGYVVDDFKADTTIPSEPPQHTCSAATVVKKDAVAGTCTEKGTIAHYACTCGKFYADAEAKTELTSIEGNFNHTYGENPTNVVDATCDRYGYKAWACTLCGAVHIENIPPKGHATPDSDRATNVVTDPATCEANGEIKWTCDCGKAMVEVLKATGCTKVEVTVDATCYTFAYKFTYCKNAGCNAKAATVPAEYMTHITCNYTDVVTVLTFEVTGAELNPANHYHAEYGVITVPANCQQQGVKIDFCNGCHVIDKSWTYGPEGHEWDKENPIPVAGATCTTAAKVQYPCKHCTAVSAVESVGEALGHKPGATVTVPASCAGNGETYKVCDNGCGVKLEYKEIEFVTAAVNGVYKDLATAETEHNLTGVKTENWRPGTCTLVGLDEYECADCIAAGKPGKVYVQTGVGGEGHKWVGDANDTTPAAKATCTTEGYIKAQVCSVCGATKPAVVLPALGHTMTKVEAADATCDKDGAVAHYNCATCGKNFEDEKGETEITTAVVIPATGHNFVVGVCTVCGFTCDHNGTLDLVDDKISTADCGKGTYGFKHYGCSACGYECWTDFVDVPEHKYEDKKIDATCTTEGKTWKECSACGGVIDEVVLPMVHTNAAGETIIDSCVNDVEDRVCVDCGETIGKACHPVTIVVEQDCMNYGYTVVACADCGDVKSTVANTELGAHKLSTEAVVVEPTYTTEGTITAVCLVCGQNVVEKIPVKSGLNIELEASNKYGFEEYVDGSYVVVKVLANANNINLWSFKVQFTYDDAVLDFVEGEVATTICGTTTSGLVTSKNGVATIVGYASNDADAHMQNVALNGDKVVLATLTFRVTTDAATKADAAFNVSYIELVDKAGEDVDAALDAENELSWTNDAISTDLYLDINKDGVRDLEDLNSMAKILAKEVPEDSDIIMAAADANHDGVIAETDLALLLQLLAEAKTYDQVIGRSK